MKRILELPFLWVLLLSLGLLLFGCARRTATGKNEDAGAVMKQADISVETDAASASVSGEKNRKQADISAETKTEESDWEEPDVLPTSTAVYEAAQGQAQCEHSPVTDPAVAATCTTTGLTVGSHCALCGEVLVPQQETSKTEHCYENGICVYCGSLEAINGSSAPYELPEIPF